MVKFSGIIAAVAVLGAAEAFVSPVVQPRRGVQQVTVPGRGGPVFNGDVEVQFGAKKAKAKPGEALKALAARIKAPVSYGCEEGKCGSCEHKDQAGKKYRICVAKVPKQTGPLILKP